MPGYPQQPPKKKKTGLIILICVLVLALLGGGGGFGYWYLMVRDDPSKPVPAGMAKTPQAAVRGYLQAVASGSSTSALSFLAVQPTSNTFLTDTVLSASNALSPITDITATMADTSTKAVPLVNATYKIGSQTVNTMFTVEKQDKYYFLDNATAQVDLSSAKVNGVGVSVSGIALSDISGSVDMFPGTYTITIDNTMLTMTSDPQFVVTDQTSVPSPTVTVDLSSDAPSQFAKFAGDSLSKCMKQDATFTSCGFGTILGMNSGKIITPKKGSVKWKFIKSSTGDFSKYKFQFDPTRPTEVSADFTIHVELQLVGTDNNPYYADYTLNSISIDFSDPSKMQATFDSSHD